MENEYKMRRVGLQMSILMGLTLSVCLSLIGQLSSGHFSVSGLLLNILVSSVVSIGIGLIIPMGPLNMTLDKSLGFKPGSIKAHLVEAFVSDLIYTPIITVIMIFLNYIRATSHIKEFNEGPGIPLAPMLAKGLAISFVAGYILIFVFQPIYMKLVFKKNGIELPQ